MIAEKNDIKKRKRAVAFIDTALCTGCEICATVCIPECIEIIESNFNFTGEANVDQERCTGCNLCAIDCPWEAITMINPDGSLKDYSKQLSRVKGFL